MLENTFIHIPNFGPRRERRLWSMGIRTWDDFLSRFGSSPFHKSYCSLISSSISALNSKDAVFFSNHLPNSETWRAFPVFNKVAYVDIETTGLSATDNDLTVIGLYDGSRTYSYVRGFNLEDFRHDIKKFDMVVTFNGSQFDLPFIRNSMKGISLPPLHSDLRFVLQSLGMMGGLKRIEEKFHIERDDDLKGLTGYDAVKLWQRYIKRGDKEALDTLVRYNAADISSLKTLMEWSYKEKRIRTGFDG